MTRDQLRPLEGQLVIVVGIRAGFRRTRVTAADLIRACRIWRWDGDRPLPSGGNWRAAWGEPDAVVDHLWVASEGPEATEIELLSRGWSVGRIGWYRRADGSVDLGYRTLPAVLIERALEPLLRAGRSLTSTEAAANLERTLGWLTEQQRLGAVLATTAPRGTAGELADWRHALARLQRSAQAEQRARAGATHGPRPRGLELFPVPATRRRRPAGIRPMEVAR